MKDAYMMDMCASLNHEFGKRCTISEQIVYRLADDLIARYSPKHQPHPDFFKQDTALALNQLTLFIDQYIQIMRKYPFLDKAATIISSLTTSSLKINEFLAKQLYHSMKIDQPNQSKHQTPNQLCAGCGKMRENEKIRILRDELNMPRFEGQRKVVRQVIGRNGQRYDMQQLIQEQLDNLDALNEQEVRKRLGMLELDHDRRNQQMLICLEELGRANDRVVGYNKTLQKKAKEGEVQFNIKDYVFQLSRHFYHNLSNIDTKIKQLKQNISPIQTMAAQTDVPCISLVEHQEQLKSLQVQKAELERNYSETKTILLIEQQKNKEQDNMINLLQSKVSKIEMEKEQDRLNWHISQISLKGTIAQSQEKIASLLKLVKRLKGITKAKNLGLSDEDLQLLPRSQSHGCQFPQDQTQETQDNNGEKQFRSYVKTMIDSRKSWKQSLLINPNLVLIQEGLDFKNIKIKGTQSIDTNTIGNPHKAVIFRLRQPIKQVKLSLNLAFNESFVPAFLSCKSEQIQNNERREPQMMMVQVGRNDNTNSNVQVSLKKDRLSRMQSNRKALDKITTINNRRSLLVLQNEHVGSPFQEINEARMYEKMHEGYVKKEKLKTTLHEQLNLKNDFYQQNKLLRQQLGLEKRENDPFQIGYQKRKKRRNFSQENSLEELRELNYRASPERPQWNQKKIFTQLNNVLQIHKVDAEIDKKVNIKKRSFYTRGEYQKAALSLQQINYSTYVYSLTAKLHLKSPANYIGLKKFLCISSGLNCEQQNSIKNALKTILLNHRACNSNGSVCKHMQALLEKIKTM